MQIKFVVVVVLIVMDKSALRRIISFRSGKGRPCIVCLFFKFFWLEDCLIMIAKQVFCSSLSSAGLNNIGCYTTSNTYSRKPFSYKIVYNCREFQN